MTDELIENERDWWAGEIILHNFAVGEHAEKGCRGCARIESTGRIIEQLSTTEAALAESRGEVERLREGLIRLVHGDHDQGWSAETYADALLDNRELSDQEWTIEDPRRALEAPHEST